MPTGPKHTYTWDEYEDGQWVDYSKDCRCTIGDDHHSSDNQGFSFDDAGNMLQWGEHL